MKVYVYPADTAGCGYVRLIWATNYLRRTGHNVVLVNPSEDTGIGGDINTQTNEIMRVRIPRDADVLVFQRVLLKHIADAIPHIRRAGTAVVVDMDDDLTKIDPNNIAFGAMHPKNRRDPDRNWNNATNACLRASMVTVSTPALMKVYAPHGRGRVIENCIPAGFLGIAHSGADAFGWTGAVASHPADARVAGPSVARLIREGFEFAMVGPSTGARSAFGLDAEPYATGYVSIQDYPVVISQTLGVGIAPLADTEFNRAKSWLKPLEYSALGIPWVGSASEEYRRFAAHGAGILAHRPRDWYREIKRLLDSEALRIDQAGRGYEVAEKYTIEGNAWRLWEAWSDALRAERRVRTGSALILPR